MMAVTIFLKIGEKSEKLVDRPVNLNLSLNFDHDSILPKLFGRRHSRAPFPLLAASSPLRQGLAKLY
jgi:hypothetical protein